MTDRVARVLIADDSRDARELLRRTLERQPSLEVVAQAVDGLDAVRQAELVRPDVVVLDVVMPRMDGIEAAREIRRRLPSTRIVVLSAFSSERIGQRAIDAGADAYLEKSVGQPELLAAIELLPPRPSTLSSEATTDADRLVLDNLAEGVLVVAADGRVESVNAAATNLLRAPGTGLVGSIVTDLFDGALREDGVPFGPGDDPVHASLVGGHPADDVVGIPRQGGGVAWLSVHARPAASAPGQAGRYVVSLADARERHAILERLRWSQRRVDDVVTTVPQALAVLTAIRDENGDIRSFRVDHLNRQAAAITGWMPGTTLHESLGGRTSYDDLVALLTDAVHNSSGVVVPSSPPSPGAVAQSANLAGLRARARGDLVIVSWVPGAAGPDQGRPETLESLLEAAVVASAEGIALLDRDGQVVLANAVADRLLGGTPLLGHGGGEQVMLRADTLAVVTTGDLPLAAVCAGEAFDDVELFLAGDVPDGGAYVKLSGRPVFDAAGNPAGAVITVHDDTARKEAESALAVAHAELKRSNAELEQYAYVASHDLSAPLRGIEGFTRLLDERYRGRLDDDADEWLHHIVASVERMRTLINDLLTYSRVTTKARPLEPVDLDALAREVVSLFEQQIVASGAEVTVEPLPTVTADPGQLAQVMQNLLANALTYVAPDVSPRVRISAEPVAGAWRITVADNGIGVRAQDRERAFGMFQRLVTADAYPGTGIGLAVARKVVERHGGTIWIEDNADGGSRVCFTLPDPGATPR